MRRPRLHSLLLAALIATCASACRTPVQFYEKSAFADPVMNMADHPMEIHWYSKVHFSVEGSIGGIGTSGGGGCGCY